MYFFQVRILNVLLSQQFCLQHRHGNRVNDTLKEEESEFSRKRMTPKFWPLTVIFTISHKYNKDKYNAQKENGDMLNSST